MRVKPLGAFGYLCNSAIIKEVRFEQVPDKSEMIESENGEPKEVMIPQEPVEIIVYAEGVIEITEQELDGIHNRTHCFAEDMKSVRPLTYAELAEQEQQRVFYQKQFEKEQIRQRRNNECFSVVNRGELWYQTLNSAEKAELAAWYRAWLDVTATNVIPQKPAWLD